MEKQPKYITTTLPYVNSDPHVGFATEVIQADALARYYRLMGHEVFFNTGTDEHGQKIAQVADAAGQSRQSYVDHYAGEFEKLKSALNLSYDNFIRTSSDAHKATAQALWQRCDENGDIYKKSFKGLYCVGDEMFLRDSDLVDGKCPNHPNMEPVELEEENYFFRLSKYQDRLIELLSDESRTLPDWQRQWALEFVKGGLEDLSISRQKSRMDWGVPVPGDDEHVMYVWFDALSNYISTLGWPNDQKFETFWTNADTLQLAGKDQVRFQSIIWQAMLMSANLPTTDTIVYHGFLNSGGQKMSKSLGNVISPFAMVERYGTDATRYLLLRHVHPFDDSDITWEKMDEWYTANLVNGLGNLVARVMKMAETHLDSPVDVPNISLNSDLGVGLGQLDDSYDFQKLSDDIWAGIKVVNWMFDVTKVERNLAHSTSIKHIDEIIQIEEPYKKIKSEEAHDVEKAIVMMKNLVTQLWYKAHELEPLMPETAQIIKDAVLTNKKPENLFKRLET